MKVLKADLEQYLLLLGPHSFWNCVCCLKAEGLEVWYFIVNISLLAKNVVM
jgi:hypothetical protein